MRLALLLFASACLWAPQAFAQAKVYGTSGMDRGQAGIARLQAQQAASANAIQAIAQCGNAGRLYGPGFSGAKSGNCPNNLTIRTGGGIAVSGGATIAGATTLSGTLAVSGTGTFGGKVTVSVGGLDVHGNTILRNNLTVSGTTSVAGAATIAGATTANGRVTANKGINVHNGWVRVYGNYGTNFADHGGGWYMSDATWVRSYGNKGVYTGGNIRADGQFQIGSSVFGPPPVCNVNTQKLYWNNGWSCKTTIGGAGAGETDPQVGGLASGKWCYSNGSQIICNQPAPTANAFRLPPACNATTSKLRWTGSTWECVTDHYGDNLGNHVATANLNMANHAIVSGAGTIRDANGGWVRTYGNTGWYNGTYGGGWYMTDSSWLRAYGNKGVYTTGEVQSGSMYSGNGNVNDMYIRAAGKWVSQIGSQSAFGGMYSRGSSGGCKFANPFTGACSCPSGYTDALLANSISGGEQYLNFCFVGETVPPASPTALSSCGPLTAGSYTNEAFYPNSTKINVSTASECHTWCEQTAGAGCCAMVTYVGQPTQCRRWTGSTCLSQWQSNGSTGIVGSQCH